MNITSLIVTYNRLDKLKETIKATLALPFEFVIVVDNASTDGTAEWLSENCSGRLIVLSSTKNNGGAGGFRYGAEWIANNVKTDWILFYDDDAYPQKDYFDKLRESSLDADTVYACKVVDTRGSRCVMNIPWRMYPRGLIENLQYILNPTKYIACKNKDEIISLSFVGMLISKKNLDNYYSCIDDSLFIYFDDVYFSYHLYLNSIPMQYISNAIVIHDVGNNHKILSSWKIYYLVRNMLLSKHLFSKKSPFSNIYIFLRLLKYFILCIRHPERKEAMKKFSLGLKDGVYGRKRKG